ncbi:MAG: response regulator, partial [Calditrichaeota bacterium]
FTNISHEFRTPLALIQGLIQQLLCREFTGDVNRRYRCILNNCNRLLFLVNQLLDLSRLEANSEKLQTRPLNIVPLTRQLVMAFESLAEMHNIQLKFEAPEPSIIVYIDQPIYEKIIVNLVSNAIKFTPDGGTVIVECAVRNAPVEEKSNLRLPPPARPGVSNSEIMEHVSIRVKDTGIGIAQEDLPHIFDRFYRINNTFRGEEEGTGIGLALTKELVTLHHGEITVKSEPGKGSTFVVYLPLGKEHLQVGEIADPRTGGSGLPEKPLADIFVPGMLKLPTEDKTTAGKRTEKPATPNSQSEIILIVEDNADMRAYLRSLLEGDYRILEAQNGEEGLQCARRQQPDLIISDVMMPHMDGFQLCENLKADTHTSHIPVILLTAKAIHQSKLRGLRIGADEYLIKPFDAVELKLRVKNVLAQRRQLRERFRRELKVEPQKVTVTSADEAFLQQALEIVETHMGDEHFDTTQFAKEIGMCRSQLNVKLRALTGCSTREFIRTLRLKRAAHLLEQGFGNVAEVAYEVGFNSLSYFAKVFKEQFGVLPSQFPARGTADAHAHTP